MSTQAKARSLFDPAIVRGALVDSFRKLDPRHQVRNPVMFVVEVGSVLTTALFVQALVGQGEAPAWFILAVSALALVHGALRQLRRGDGRGPRQGAGRHAAQGAQGHPREAARRAAARRGRSSRSSAVASSARATIVLVEAGEFDPGRRRDRRGRRVGRRERHHGRERAGHPRERRRPQRRHRRHARALRLARRAHHREPGRDLPRPHDRDGRGREAAEDAERDRARHPARRRSRSSSCSRPSRCCRSRSTASNAAGQGTPITVTVLVALLVCLIPTTIGGLLSAIGIAGMDRMIQANVIAISGRAVEAAGDVDVLLLDKTGTITLGNRQATAFVPGAGRHRAERLADAAQLALARRRDARGAQHRRAREGEVRHPRARRARARGDTSCRSPRRRA